MILNKETKGSVAQVPPFFKDRVIQRVLEASLEEKKDGSGRQIKMVTEIAFPDNVSIDGIDYVIGGQKITHYLGLSTEVSDGARQSSWASTYDFLEKCGLPTEIDTDDPLLSSKIETMFKDLTFENILESRENIPQRKKIGADGKIKYEQILDGRGQPIKQGFQWNTFLNGVIGRSTVELNKPY